MAKRTESLQHLTKFAAVIVLAVTVVRTRAQTGPDLAVLRGLAPVSTLAKTSEGRAALGANYAVTGGIQRGSLHQSTLLPFAEQQQQALRDAFITEGNLAELADGLGTTLGAAYIAKAHYLDRDHFTSLSPAVAALIAYANTTSAVDSNSAKYFFANGTTNGKTQVKADAAALLTEMGGTVDVFGKAYGHPGGSAGSNAYGNSRPFQTESELVPISGPDYLGHPADNTVYSRGPLSNLIDSPSFPSGHTTYGYTGSLLLAILVPERYEQMVTRGAEYGNDRILVGAHYAMDVLGGRTLALYDMAHLLANDPAYMNRTLRGSKPISDFREAVKVARADMKAALQAACGNTLAVCAREDTGRFSNPASNSAFYAVTQTYSLPVVYAEPAAGLEDVGTLAPEAGYLLTAVFPALSLSQADQILTETEGPGGGFLDDGSAFGVYSRLDLLAAHHLAAAQLSVVHP